MKAVTLTPEWAWAVMCLDKRVENRSWAPGPAVIGQRVAIHAGKAAPDWEGVRLMARCARWNVSDLAGTFSKPGRPMVRLPEGKALVRGAIVGTALVRRWRHVPTTSIVGWEVGPVCWDLEEVQVLEQPVPCTGALGLWTVPEAVEADVAAGAWAAGLEVQGGR